LKGAIPQKTQGDADKRRRKKIRQRNADKKNADKDKKKVPPPLSHLIPPSKGVNR
jgi:hypothetical protein